MTLIQGCPQDYAFCCLQNIFLSGYQINIHLTFPESRHVLRASIISFSSRSSGMRGYLSLHCTMRHRWVNESPSFTELEVVEMAFELRSNSGLFSPQKTVLQTKFQTLSTCMFSFAPFIKWILRGSSHSLTPCSNCHFKDKRKLFLLLDKQHLFVVIYFTSSHEIIQGKSGSDWKAMLWFWESRPFVSF